MVTVLRASSFRISIFKDEHPPAHVHVFGDGQVKINLTGADGDVELVWWIGMKKSDVRKAMRIVSENRLRLLASWNEIHD